MPHNKSEYSQPTVGGSGCAYKNLGCYNGANGAMAALRPGVTSGVFVTPNYSSIGYNALTHGTAPECCSRPHFNIVDAYGTGSGSCCTSYTTRLCGGGCGPK
jgi:hypothetical protein